MFLDERNTVEIYLSASSTRVRQERRFRVDDSSPSIRHVDMGKSPTENFRDFIDAALRLYTAFHRYLSVRSLTHATDRPSPRAFRIAMYLSAGIIEGILRKISYAFVDCTTRELIRIYDEKIAVTRCIHRLTNDFPYRYIPRIRNALAIDRNSQKQFISYVPRIGIAMLGRYF